MPRTSWKGWTIYCLLVAMTTAWIVPSKADPLPKVADEPLSAVLSIDIKALRPRPRPVGLGTNTVRCTADGVHCISLDSYIRDTCRVIEATAQEAGLNQDFFVRLIWRESLFDASAVSPAGAQGIAQFMPGTAQLRGLADPFNPAEALRASAAYLAELTDDYGNLGFAAAAYNAGEARLEDFLHRDRRLPPETRAYVPAITGYSAVEWRDAPPETPDFALETAPTFREACEVLGRKRRLKEFHRPASVLPWAAILASHPSRDIAVRRYQRIRGRSAALQSQMVSYVRRRLLGQPVQQWTAQIGAQTRKGAERICTGVRRGGVPCIVLKN